MQRKSFDSINVVPFIDIMLVLLVIVLTTASFIQMGAIKIDLPKASSQTIEEPQKELQISINKEGVIYFDEKAVAKEDVNATLLTYEREKPVYLHCDKDARYDHFVFVLDLLKKNNFSRLGIVTKNE